MLRHEKRLKITWFLLIQIVSAPTKQISCVELEPPGKIVHNPFDYFPKVQGAVVDMQTHANAMLYNYAYDARAYYVFYPFKQYRL